MPLANTDRPTIQPKTGTRSSSLRPGQGLPARLYDLPTSHLHPDATVAQLVLTSSLSSSGPPQVVLALSEPLLPSDIPPRKDCIPGRIHVRNNIQPGSSGGLEYDDIPAKNGSMSPNDRLNFSVSDRAASVIGAVYDMLMEGQGSAGGGDASGKTESAPRESTLRVSRESFHLDKLEDMIRRVVQDQGGISWMVTNDKVSPRRRSVDDTNDGDATVVPSQDYTDYIVEPSASQNAIRTRGLRFVPFPSQSMPSESTGMRSKLQSMLTRRSQCPTGTSSTAGERWVNTKPYCSSRKMNWYAVGYGSIPTTDQRMESVHTRDRHQYQTLIKSYPDHLQEGLVSHDDAVKGPGGTKMTVKLLGPSTSVLDMPHIVQPTRRMYAWVLPLETVDGGTTAKT